MTFEFLINTGARINEAINVKAGDIDIPNKRLILRVTKIKAAKKEKTPRPRQISISTQFARKLNKYIKDANLQDGDYLGLITASSAHQALKNGLVRAGIKDWFMFSLHNIRKTHGNWLKALGIDGAEICTRLGHDYNTFIKAYGSADVFTLRDKQDMRLIIGDLYQQRSLG
jgi:integrase